MATGVASDLRAIFEGGTVAGLTDGQLLERFASGQGEEAERKEHRGTETADADEEAGAAEVRRVGARVRLGPAARRQRAGEGYAQAGDAAGARREERPPTATAAGIGRRDRYGGSRLLGNFVGQKSQ